MVLAQGGSLKTLAPEATTDIFLGILGVEKPAAVLTDAPAEFSSEEAGTRQLRKYGRWGHLGTLMD